MEIDKRSSDREVVYQMIFSTLFPVEDGRVSLEESLNMVRENEDIFNKEYIVATYNGILEHQSELEDLIKPSVQDYELSGLYKTDFVALLLAVYEVKYANLSMKVAINEVIKLCKKFSTEKGARFVNGVLAGVFGEQSDE